MEGALWDCPHSLRYFVAVSYALTLGRRFRHAVHRAKKRGQGQPGQVHDQDQEQYQEQDHGRSSADAEGSTVQLDAQIASKVEDGPVFSKVLVLGEAGHELEQAGHSTGASTTKCEPLIRHARECHVVGTCHVSTHSAYVVRNTIRKLRPSVVALELCEERRGILGRNARSTSDSSIPSTDVEGESPTTGKRERQSGKRPSIIAVLISMLYSVASRLINVEPAAEFLAAVEEAEAIEAEVRLIDRSSSVTLARAWGSMGLMERLDMAVSIVGSCILLTSFPWAFQSQLETLGAEPVDETAVRQMTMLFPGFYLAISDERDLWLAVQLYELVSNPSGFSLHHPSDKDQNQRSVSSTSDGVPSEQSQSLGGTHKLSKHGCSTTVPHDLAGPHADDMGHSTPDWPSTPMESPRAIAREKVPPILRSSQKHSHDRIAALSDSDEEVSTLESETISDVCALDSDMDTAVRLALRELDRQYNHALLELETRFHMEAGRIQAKLDALVVAEKHAPSSKETSQEIGIEKVQDEDHRVANPRHTLVTTGQSGDCAVGQSPQSCSATHPNPSFTAVAVVGQAHVEGIGRYWSILTGPDQQAKRALQQRYSSLSSPHPKDDHAQASLADIVPHLLRRSFALSAWAYFTVAHTVPVLLSELIVGHIAQSVRTVDDRPCQSITSLLKAHLFAGLLVLRLSKSFAKTGYFGWIRQFNR